MTTAGGTDPAAEHGSERSERENAIVGAVLELLGERGYERLTMDAVAARAHASKATIYRRWQGKPALVVAAMRAHIAAQPLEISETGELRHDLLVLLGTIRERFNETNRSLMIGLLHAAESDRELGAMVRAEIVTQKRAVRELIARGTAAAGVEPPDLELIREMGPSTIAVRMLLTREPVEDAYLERLVDEVMLPLLTRNHAQDPRTGSHR